MPKRYSAKEVLRILHKYHFDVVSQKGSHMKLRGVVGGKLQTVIVPNHKVIATGTLSSIIRQSGLTKDDFDRC